MSTIKEIIQFDSTLLTKDNLPKLKRQWAKALGHTPKNSELLAAFPQLRTLLQTRSVRSRSGVTPLAVMMKPFPCPGQCIYCPQEKGMPKSYFSDEPAAARAKMVNFDPVAQITFRLEQLRRTGHDTSKLELIVIGGTFSAYPQTYRRKFFHGLYNTCNGQKTSNLTQAQKANESALRRIVGISIETRPDCVSEAEVKFIRQLGVTRIQLGVQAFDDEILKIIKRNHGLDAVAKATLLLRNTGLKICYHFMPNLPGSNPKKDIQMAKIMYTDPRFQPDSVKIYPCMVIPGTELATVSSYITYSDTVLLDTLKQIKLLTPPTVRIDRLVRDISKKWISSGTQRSNMRQMLQVELKKEAKHCRCIRCREIKSGEYAIPNLQMITNQTVGGQEIFLSFEKGGNLYSLLRLRLPELDNTMFPELSGAAIIREVHSFGTALPLKSHQANKTQHQGLGRKLITKAEEITKSHGFLKVAIISAIGTRNYYRKLGYHLEGLYMTKSL